MLHPDQKYINALIQNDSNTIRDIYKLHFQKVRRIVLLNNGTEMDADDLFQELLIELYKKALAGFELSCPLGGFLHIMARSRWINELQKKKCRSLSKHESKQYHSLLQEETNPLINVFELKEALVKEKLNELTENSRKLLLLTWTGHPLKEIAHSMHCSYGYLRKRKTQCMAKLITMVRRSPKIELLRS